MRPARRRFVPDAETTGAEVWTRRAVLGNAALGALAGLLSLFVHTSGHVPAPAIAVLVGLLVLTSCATYAAPGKAPGSTRLVLAWLGQVAVAGVLAFLEPVTLLPAALLAAQTHLAMRLRNDLFASGSLTVGAAQGLVAFLFMPTGRALLLFLATFETAMIGAVLLHGRATRRNMARALRTAKAPSDASGTGARARYAMVLAFVLLIGAFALQGTFRGAERWWESIRSDSPATGRESTARNPLGAPGSAPGVASDDSEAGASFDDQLDYSQPFFGTGDSLILRVRPVRGHAGGSSLYLRALVLDRFTTKGVGTSSGVSAAPVTDATDGVMDGWTSLRTGLPASREFEIEQIPIRMPQTGAATLLATVEPVQAVTQSPVRFDPDRALVDASGATSWIAFGLRAGPDPIPSMLGRAQATHADTSMMRVPRCEATDELTDLAASLVVGSSSDIDRVQAIVGHFQTQFGYSIEAPGSEGIAALQDLLAKRTGYCVQFASAAALMLRSQGIPARVVQGFLADEWVEVAGLYDVYPTDVHAWIEVHFVGTGWVRFDPTPAAERAAQQSSLAEQEGQWADDALGLLRTLMNGDDELTLDDIAALLARGPGAFARAIRRGPLVILAIVLIAVGIFLVMPGRGRRAGTGSPLPPEQAEAIGHYARITRELARHGHRKRASQTPREFAVTLAGTGDHVMLPLRSLTERVYEARFGGRALTASDVAAIDAFISDLRRTERAQR